MMGGQTPILILKEGTSREKGKGAHKNNIAAAKAIADAIRSTLGPRGMDKMLVDSMGDVVITNDGVTILKEIDVEHPAAKMLVEVAKTQDAECGDGTTTSVVLAGELLKKAEELLDANVHPTVIAAGYRMAADKSLDVLEANSLKISTRDTKKLKRIASTALRSKIADQAGEMLSDISVQAVKAVAEKRGTRFVVDVDNIQIVKKQGGSINDTELIEGVILDKEPVHTGMPHHIPDPKIALLDSSLEIKKTEVDAKIQIRDPAQLQAFLDQEEATLKEMVDKIVSTGANVAFCQKGVDDLAQHYLAKAGIYTVRRVKKSDMEKLSKATGADIITDLDDLKKSSLGSAGEVDLRTIGDDKMTFVSGCKKAAAVSIMLRGGTEHIVDEMDRSLHDSLSVVAVAIEDGRIAAGGGASAIEIALKLRDYAATVGGREQMAIDAFADAVEIVPKTLAENAGLDSINAILDLRQAHKKGQKYAGLNVHTGKVVNMVDAEVIEPLRVGTQAIQSATEAAVMVLRIDDVIAAKAGGGMPGGMPGGDMGGMGDMDY
ncbi:MAG: TCP-1/cpn60 chaperonin family protein [Thermoplasmata archaeon]|nr:MAG: TCP-1/cpn60 chaperonin family protein [Thermoplasmata archaeon]